MIIIIIITRRTSKKAYQVRTLATNLDDPCSTLETTR